MAEIWREFINNELSQAATRWLDAPKDFSNEDEPSVARHLNTLRYQLLREIEPKEKQAHERFSLDELEEICQERDRKLSKAVASRLVGNLVEYMADSGWLTDGSFNSQTGRTKTIDFSEIARNKPFRLIFAPRILAEFQEYLADLAQISGQSADLVYYHRKEAERLKSIARRSGRF